MRNFLYLSAPHRTRTSANHEFYIFQPRFKNVSRFGIITKVTGEELRWFGLQRKKLFFISQKLHSRPDLHPWLPQFPTVFLRSAFSFRCGNILRTTKCALRWIERGSKMFSYEVPEKVVLFPVLRCTPPVPNRLSSFHLCFLVRRDIPVNWLRVQRNRSIER